MESKQGLTPGVIKWRKSLFLMVPKERLQPNGKTLVCPATTSRESISEVPTRFVVVSTPNLTMKRMLGRDIVDFL